jgi:hypothetical protein
MLLPVALPPGRAKLATMPSLTGSLPMLNTIGTVADTALTVKNDGSPPPVTITTA